MKFKLDENLPARAAHLLRDSGHDALTLLDQLKAGASDSVVAQLVRDEGRALITLDLDFADIRTYEPKEFPGIVVLRPRRSDASAVLSLIGQLVVALEHEKLDGCLWVVDDERIRIRDE